MDLAQFWCLASAQNAVRENACAELLEHLIKVQKGFTDHSPHVHNESIDFSKNEMAMLFHPDLIYAFSRLIRGLSSSRNGAREGFSLALTELLRILFERVSVKSVIELIVSENSGSGALKGQEEREMLFGRLFGLMAVVEAIDPSLPFDKTSMQFLVGALVACGEKPYTRESSFAALVKLTQKFGGVSSAEHEQSLINCFSAAGLFDPANIKVDSISLFATIERYFRSIPAPLPLRQMGFSDENQLLSNGNIHQLSSLLKGSIEYAHPRVHSVWQHLLFDGILVASCENDFSLLCEFWKIAVDEALMLCSNERKFLGLQLYKNIFGMVVAKHIPISVITTSNIIRCLITSSQSFQHPLHEAAKQTLQFIGQSVEGKHALAWQLLSAVSGVSTGKSLLKNTNGSLASLNSGTWNSILISAFNGENGSSDSGVAEYVEWLLGSFIGSSLAADSDDVAKVSISNHHRWCLDQLLSLCKAPSIPKSAWMDKFVEFLLLNGWYRVCETTVDDLDFAVPDAHLPMESRDLCRSRFWQVLTVLVLRNDSAKQGYCPLNFIIERIKRFDAMASIECGKRHSKKQRTADSVILYSRLVPLRADISADHISVLGDSWRILNSLHFCGGKEAEFDKYFSQTASLLLIKAYLSQSETEISEVSSVLQELNSCFDRRRQSATDNEGPKPASVLADLSLSLIINPSSVGGSNNQTARLCKFLIERLLKSVANELDESGILTICRMFDPVYAAESAMEETEDGSEQSEAAYSSGEETLMDGEIEFGADEFSNGDGEDLADDDASSVDEAFRQKVHEALQGATTQYDGESDEPIDSDDNLDDEQMVSMGFDDKLADIFKERRQEKAEKAGAIRSMIEFKNRALDLVDVCIKEYGRRGITEKNLPLVSALCSSLIRSSIYYLHPAKCLEQAKDNEYLSFQINEMIMPMAPENRNQLALRMLAILKKSLVKTELEKISLEPSVAKYFHSLLFMVASMMTGEFLELNCLKPRDNSIVFPAVCPTHKECTSTLSDVLIWISKYTRRNGDLSVQKAIFHGPFSARLVVKNKSLPIAVFSEFFSRNAAGSFGESWSIAISPLIRILIAESTADSRPVKQHQKVMTWKTIADAAKHMDFERDTEASVELCNAIDLGLKELYSNQHQQIDGSIKYAKELLSCFGGILRKITKLDPKDVPLENLTANLQQIITLDVYKSNPSIRNLCSQLIDLLSSSGEHPAKRARKQ